MHTYIVVSFCFKDGPDTDNSHETFTIFPFLVTKFHLLHEQVCLLTVPPGHDTSYRLESKIIYSKIRACLRIYLITKFNT